MNIDKVMEQRLHDEKCDFPKEDHFGPIPECAEQYEQCKCIVENLEKELTFANILKLEVKMPKVIMVTGHRPNKLPGRYNLKHPDNQKLVKTFEKILEKAQPTSIITGMALGADQLFLIAALNRRAAGQKFTIVAAIPCPEQAQVWPEASILQYEYLLSKVDYVKTISPRYTKTCMEERNRWMVEKCTSAVAVYDGTPGGTQMTVNYLCEAKKTVLVIHPRTGATSVIKKGDKQ